MEEQKKQPVHQVHKPRATVCHRALTTDVTWYPHAEYHGRTIYFCTEFCLDAFIADPERFYLAHSKVKK